MTIIIVISLITILCYWLFMSPYSQIFGVFPYEKKDCKEKVIALTFDDGPNEPFTSQILDFLDTEDIKATFFQVAKAVQKYPDISRSMIKSGHVIGNHSLSHKFSNYISQPSFKKEIESSQKIFKSVIGKEPVFFRPPWLFRTPILLKSLRSFGLIPVSGIFCSDLEVFHVNSKSLASTTIKRARPGGILIFHDGYNGKGADRRQTVEGLKIAVKQLRLDGYEFVTVSELFDIKPYL